MYRSAVLYYDRETETFWSQMTGQGVVGPQTGKQLKWLDSEVTTWGDWLKRHPETTVLKPPDPRGWKAYARDGYAPYHRSERTYFPIGNAKEHPLFDKYPKKSLVTIVKRQGKALCYPHKAFDGTIRDRGLTITRTGMRVKVTDGEGKNVPSMQAYWFGWCAFYADGIVYDPAAKKAPAAPPAKKPQ